MVDFGGGRIDDALADDAVEIDLGDDDADADDQPQPGVDRVVREVRAELENGTFRGGDRRRDDHDARRDGGPEAAVTPTPPAGDAPETVDLGTAGDEQATRRDVEALFEARDAAGKILRQAPLMRRETGDRKADESVHAAVAQFLRESESILKKTAPGQEVWYDTGGEILGTVRLPRPTPSPNEHYELHGDAPRLVKTSVPSRMVRGDEIVLRCLKDYIEAGDPITATWEFESISTAVFDPDVTTRRKTEETSPSRALSGTVYRQCRGALQASGVGADVSDGADGGASLTTEYRE
jgi:hypothetical protein